MKKRMKIYSVWLAIVMILSLFIFPACQSSGTGDGQTVKVMVEKGAHYQVMDDAVKEVKIGENVSFYISIDEGYYYVSNNCGAEFIENQLILRNVKAPKTIVIEVKANTYIVQLHETEGLKVRDGETFAQKSVSLEVAHGNSAVFEVEIDEGYEYYQNEVNSADGNNQSAVYKNGELLLSNVCSNKEIFVQLRKSAVSEQENVTVKLLENEAFTIRGENEQQVKFGTDAIFIIDIHEGYYYISNNCGAEYNETDGKIVFKEAKADQEIRLVFGKLNTKTMYYANGSVEISAVGGAVIYSAKPNGDYLFNGWFCTNEGEKTLYAYANHLKLQGSEIENIELEPNFVSAEANKLVTYHANGGEVIGSEDETVTYVFNHEVYLYPAAFGEWCFKTFYREGYAPIEYNTKPDGSGIAISLGSRIFLDKKEVDLYLIWAEENKARDFTYTYVEENNKESGVKLLKYVGTALNVVIPTEIEGNPVTVISSDCFEKQDIKSVVITKNVKTVENDAFANCSALETVYMCDSVEIISDESFLNCNALANLRMIATLPPVYCDHLIGATVRRFELLYNTRNDLITNIMFYGGSSIFQGIDGETLSRFFNTEEYRVMNCGQNAFVSGPLMLELYSYFMGSRDIMVYIPEYSIQTYSNKMELPSWIALEAFYDAFRYIDLRDYPNVFNAFYDIQHGSKEYVYTGKLQQIKDRNGLSYDAYDNTFDEYFTRGENFQITKVNLSPRSDEPTFEEMKGLVLNQVNRIYKEKYEAQNLTMYFAYFGFWEDAYAKEAHEPYENWLKQNLAFPYISNYLNHMFSIEYISDSISHLTYEGAVKHSNVLGPELKAQMRVDGYP